MGQSVLDPELAAKVLRGFQIAPVPLNMVGRDATLVGYGSYLINAVGDCNGCHSSGPQAEYVQTGNPYTGAHPTVNPATYLGGGRDFGAFPDPNGNFPHIYSRNLTPDKTGMPGGDSFSTFQQIIRTGTDMDHLHPTCSGPPNGKCLPPPFNGDLLQIMPWPILQNMTDNDLRAIYEYLSAIPCVDSAAKDRCAGGAKTAAVASPKATSATTRQVQLDGSKSTSVDGKALTYSWSIPQGSPAAAISQGNTATPTVTFTVRGTYTFQLTVTDSSGVTSTDTASITYLGG
jgi:hypothetical protein